MRRVEIATDADAIVAKRRRPLRTMHLAKQGEAERVRSRTAELDVALRVRIVPEQPESALPDLYRLAGVVAPPWMR